MQSLAGAGRPILRPAMPSGIYCRAIPYRLAATGAALPRAPAVGPEVALPCQFSLKQSGAEALESAIAPLFTFAIASSR
jgi:hypothetical protein